MIEPLNLGLALPFREMLVDELGWRVILR